MIPQQTQDCTDKYVQEYAGYSLDKLKTEQDRLKIKSASLSTQLNEKHIDFINGYPDKTGRALLLKEKADTQLRLLICEAEIKNRKKTSPEYLGGIVYKLQEEVREKKNEINRLSLIYMFYERLVNLMIECIPAEELHELLDLAWVEQDKIVPELKTIYTNLKAQI